MRFYAPCSYYGDVLVPYVLSNTVPNYFIEKFLSLYKLGADFIL